MMKVRELQIRYLHSGNTIINKLHLYSRTCMRWCFFMSFTVLLNADIKAIALLCKENCEV